MSKAETFAFGDPEPVLSSHITDNLGIWLLDNGRYYSTPTPWTGLARLLRANAYHGPILDFKTQLVMRGFKGSKVLKRRAMLAATTDYNVFANSYFQLVRNHFKEVIEVRHLPAINMRRAKEPDTYCILNTIGEIVNFKAGEVVHIKNYDVSQSVYGMPGYLGAIQSMLLNEDATLFRRKYYLNGAHTGYIFYSSSASLGEKEQNEIRKSLKSTKGPGNFKNTFLHIPNGREKDIQIIPVGDFSTKDELEKIKNISRDDIIAAHRMPPALAAIIPQNMTGFGDITKVDAVYKENEIEPIRETLLEINDHLLNTGKISFEAVQVSA
ncbi:phage portal protein [Maridesulfovibrio ferrireducens]|uniref:phage portal protein n=1 Tax=Maridesulfovibrio ferrireducens TaxID=246191 RepID=UPI001A18390A|nr:phage portal protein [Maridesulfovibrio ferrireducens]MBI9109896.1 phage portal protein [Maridesulfovibrio ferrireducens]